MRLEETSELGGVCADKVVDLLAVLEEEKGGDGADLELLRDFGNLVDVKLDEMDLVLEVVRVGVPGGVSDLSAPRQLDSLFQNGRNGLAGRAPVGVRVDNDDLVVGDGLAELVGAERLAAFRFHARERTC